MTKLGIPAWMAIVLFAACSPSHFSDPFVDNGLNRGMAYSLPTTKLLVTVVKKDRTLQFRAEPLFVADPHKRFTLSSNTNALFSINHSVEVEDGLLKTVGSEDTGEIGEIAKALASAILSPPIAVGSLSSPTPELEALEMTPKAEEKRPTLEEYEKILAGIPDGEYPLIFPREGSTLPIPSSNNQLMLKVSVGNPALHQPMAGCTLACLTNKLDGRSGGCWNAKDPNAECIVRTTIDTAYDAKSGTGSQKQGADLQSSSFEGFMTRTVVTDTVTLQISYLKPAKQEENSKERAPAKIQITPPQIPSTIDPDASVGSEAKEEERPAVNEESGTSRAAFTTNAMAAVAAEDPIKDALTARDARLADLIMDREEEYDLYEAELSRFWGIGGNDAPDEDDDPADDAVEVRDVAYFKELSSRMIELRKLIDQLIAERFSIQFKVAELNKPSKPKDKVFIGDDDGILGKHHFVVSMTDDRSVIHVPMTRGAVGVTKQEYTIAKGVLLKSEVEKPSQLLETLKIPTEVAKEIVSVPAELFSKVGTSRESQAKILAQEKAILDNQLGLLQSQDELERVQGLTQSQSDEIARLKTELQILQLEQQISELRNGGETTE